jgi:hypothetical protein
VTVVVKPCSDDQFGLEPIQFGAHADAQKRIERREGLVEQQHLRLGHERSCECDALLLPARKLGRQALCVSIHLDEHQHLAGAFVTPCFRESTHLQAERPVVETVQMREQRIVLEHERRAAHRRREIPDRPRADDDVPVGRGLVSGDRAQGRGPAAAGGPQETAIGPRSDLQIDAVDREGLAVAFCEACEFDIHARAPRGSSSKFRAQAPA